MLLLALLAAVASVTGTVSGGGPLPGIPVTLRSGSYNVTCITDAHGAYTFANVPLGSYNVKFELDGLKTATRDVRVSGGTNVIPPVEMTPSGTSCEMLVNVACREKTPSTPWEYPLCSDFGLDRALIDSAKRGDRSAIELLERRYATTFTYMERWMIGGALLGRARDDRAIWSELSGHAERLVAAGGDTKKLDPYCAAHDFDAYEYESMAWDAFSAAWEDRRARPLLLRALASDDSGLAQAGIFGLALQHDDTPRAEIEAAVRRHPELVFDLAEFHSEAIDALAAKYLKDDDERAEYRNRATASP
jgi:hypothetical protein